MFSEKKLKVEITLYDYEVSSDGKVTTNFASGKVLTFENFRIECKINKVPSPSGYTASIDIYGVSEQSLNQITTIAWIDGSIRPRGVRIYANDGNGYVLLFEGGIMEAVPNYKNVPDVSIHIESSMLVFPNLKKVSSADLEKGTSITNQLQKLCSGYGYNCVVDPLLDSVVGLKKTYNQARIGDRIAAFCRNNPIVRYNFKGNSFCFYKKDSKRTPYVLRPKDYVGYPTFNNFGINVMLDTLWDINCGDYIRIENSSVGPANDTWVVNKVEFKLETRKPKGAWNVTIGANRVKL